MSKGNDIHDALFDNEAVNLSVQDAVEMAGDKFSVHSLGQQYVFFGHIYPKIRLIILMDSQHRRQCVGIASECSLYKC